VSLREVYAAASILDAQLLCDMLVDAGFEAQVFGGYLTGAVGEIPPDSLIKVLVKCDDIEYAWQDNYKLTAGASKDPDSQVWRNAREVVEEFELNLNKEAYPRVCRQCGEQSDSRFTHCWSCQALLPSHDSI